MSAPTPDRARLRACVFLDAVLPLVELVAPERRALPLLLRGAPGSVQIEVEHTDLRACLRFASGRVGVSSGGDPHARQRWIFRDARSLNAFFSGHPALPRVEPLGGLSHPLLLARTAALLASLRVLEPTTATPPPAERALRVRLVLYLITRALARLHREGWEPIAALAHQSPERVYQWTVGGSPIAAFVRMKQGRVQSGRGLYARRSPFVHFAFRDVDAAFDVINATQSQMTGYRGGAVQTLGSPEYTRKMALLMQQVDQLLIEG